MQLITFADSILDLERLHRYGVAEVILSDQRLSRQGQHGPEMVLMLAAAARVRGMKVFLQWDALLHEEQLAGLQNYLQAYQGDFFDAIRVQDIGALAWAGQLFPTLPVHLILENGHRNLWALKRWLSYVGPRLQRLVLSLEIPFERLRHYRQELNCELELMICGPIPLFYSPRKLLSPLLPMIKQDCSSASTNSSTTYTAVAASEESPHKGFTVAENTHGTFMYHTKDLFLLDRLPQLQQLDFHAYRLDLRKFASAEAEFFWSQLTRPWTEVTEADASWSQQLKDRYPGEITRGFFTVNKTDVLFSKLKNTREKNSSCCGEIIAVAKERYLALKMTGIGKQLKVGDTISMVTPEGKKRTLTITFMHSLQGRPISSANRGDLVLINYCKGISVKSVVENLA